MQDQDKRIKRKHPSQNLNYKNTRKKQDKRNKRKNPKPNIKTNAKEKNKIHEIRGRN